MATTRTLSRTAAKLLMGTALATAGALPALAQTAMPASTNAGTISGAFVQAGAGPVITGATTNTAGADSTTLTMGSPRTILNWNSFNLNAGDTLNYVFASNSDIVLNRVTGGTGTQINGNLSGFLGSTAGAYGGNVWFLDNAGIAVGGNAVVNVGGLLLSTAGLTDADFFDDNSFNFSGAGSGPITVASDLGPVGQLTAANGAITLLGSQIIFGGRANASGSNALIGANSAQILFSSNLDAYVGITITEGASQNVSVGSAATFDAGAAASGGRTIIAAAGTSNLGQILFSGTSADRVDFVEGDVVIYSAASTTGANDPRSIVAGGAVQDLVSGAAPNLLPAYINATGGSVDIRGAGNVVVDGLTASAGSVRIEAGDLLTVNSSVSTKGDYSIIADDWTGGFAFTPTFTGGAGVGDFNITDTAGGLTIGGRTAPDDLRITTVNGGLTIIGGALTATAGNVELTTIGGGDIQLQDAVTDTGADDTVKLNSAGAIWQTSGAITAGTLTGSSVGYASLTSATNQIVNLGAFSAGAMTLRDVGGLTIGNVLVGGGAGGVDVQTTGALMVNGSQVRAGAGGTLLLNGTTGTTLNSADLDGLYDVSFGSGGVSSTGTTTIDAGNSFSVSSSALNVAGNLTVTAANNASFGTVNGGGGLTVNAGADTYFLQNVGATTALGSLTTNAGGTTQLYGTIRTSGAQSYGDAVSLINDSILSSTSGGAITFNSTIDGARNLTVNTAGQTAFNGAVGGSSALTSLTTDVAGTNLLNANINTNGNQSYGGNSTLGGSVAASSGTVLFNGGVILSAGTHRVTGTNVTFNSSITANDLDDVTLRVNGTAAGVAGKALFAGAVTGIDGLAVDAGAVQFNTTNRVGTLALNLDQGGYTFDNNGLLTIGTVDGIAGITLPSGDSYLSATGGILLLANITSPGVLGLQTGSGAITQAAGTGVNTSWLSVSAGSYEAVLADVLLTGNNNVGTVSGSAYGNVILNNNGSLTISGLTGATGVTVATTGNMVVSGVINNSHVGNVSLTAGGTMVINENITADHAFTTHGNVSLTSGGLMSAASGKSIVANDIALTAPDWSGTFGTAFLQELRDVSITDTASGLSIGAATGLDAVRNLSVSTIGGDLTIGGVDPGGSATLSSSGALTIADTMYVAGDLTATAAGPIAINSIAASGGDALIRSTGGALSIGALGQINGTMVTLAAATSFNNAGGASAINASNRWLVYSANPAGDTFGGLNSNNSAIWNSAYGNVDPATLSGNRYIFTFQPTLTVTTIDASKVYGTDLSGSTASLYSITGLHPGVAGAFLGDTAASAFSGGPLISSGGLAANADVAGGPYAVTVSPGTMVSTAGYAFAFASNGAITVTPRTINGTVAANDKIYDGTLAATGSVSLSGVLFGDDVTASALLAFADKNAGSTKTVTISGGSLSGADASNYTLSLPASTLAAIFQKAISGTVIADDKIYDGNTNATGSVSLTGVIGGDSVTASALLAFADKNAGSNKVVTISGGSLTGADAGNYSLSLPASTLASILQKALTATVTASNKTYDGTTSATGAVSLDNLVAGDSVTATADFAFADRNAGSGKTVNVTNGALSGADAGNYTLTLPASVAADIFQKAIAANVVADSRTYDGTTAATGSVTLAGVVDGDDIGTAGATFAFADKNAGTDKIVSVNGVTLTGADAGNYAVIVPPSVLAAIFQKAITASIVADSKTYDGTVATTGSVSLTGVVAGDTVGTSAGTYAFDNKNAGTGKTVTISGVALTGADAANYSVTIPTSALADILQKALTANVSADSRTYDGTTAATGSVSLTGVLAGDTVDTTVGTYAFGDKNAGTGKAVTVSGVTLTGADAGNYSVTIPSAVIADIFQKSITATIAADNKTYDGNTSATGTVTLAGILSGDSVTGVADLAFADKNAGTGKSVIVSNAALSGADAGNYALAAPANATANIAQKAIGGIVTADSKTYDGTTATTGTVALTGIIAGDDVSGSANLAFVDKNAGAGKAVAVTGAVLSGGDAGNYTVTLPASTVADILKKAITASVSADSKTYDGTTAATGTITLAGVISGDSVTGSASLAFADKNAGSGKTVGVSNGSLSGTDAGNYSLSLPAAVVADIMKRAITVSADAQTKTQGSADPALTYGLSQGSLVAGESLSGALSRTPGENPGAYAIEQGNLAASANYELTFVGNTLTIEAKVPSAGPSSQDEQRALLSYLAGLAARDDHPLVVLDERDPDCGAGQDLSSRCDKEEKISSR